MDEVHNNLITITKPRCNKEMDHACEGCAFFGGIVLASIFWLCIVFIYQDYWEKWAIRNDMAYYDQSTGRLIYKGVK